MTDFTDEDVQRGAEAIYGVRFDGSMTEAEGLAQSVLAAVLPTYAKRVRAEFAQQILDGIERDAWGSGDIAVICWHEVAEARADAEEGR